jgi:hypothetical protein
MFYSSQNNNSIKKAMKESARHDAKPWEVMVSERALSMAFPTGIQVF